MTDPFNHLRSTLPQAPDTYDEARLRAHVADLIAGDPPGSTTRRRRAAIGGTAGGLACVGAAVALLVTQGGTASPVAHRSATPTAVVTDAVVPDPDASAPAGIKSAGWYLEQSVEAVMVADGILETRDKVTIQHPDEDKPSSSGTVDYEDTDGSASRWMNVLDEFTEFGRSSEGAEEVRVLTDPDGTMQYYYVDAQAGVYMTFPVAPEDYVDEEEGVGTVQEQIVAGVVELRDTLTAVADHERAGSGWLPAMVTRTEIDGAPATCYEFAADPDSFHADENGMFKPGFDIYSDSTSVTELWCLDEATNLPLRYEMTDRYVLDEFAPAESLWTITRDYRWLARTPQNEDLLAPHLDGLREVDGDEFYELTK